MRSLVRAALLVWGILTPWLPGGLAEPLPRPKRVLVLQWYDRGFPVNAAFDEEFQEALRAASHEGIEYYSEYLETNMFPGEEQSRLLSEYLGKKYASRAIDVLVARASPSLDFLLHYRSALFPHIPIVFATARPLPAHLADAGATGIVYANSYARTTDLALKLHPKTKQIFVISGTLDHDRSLESIARSELKPYEKKVTISYLTDLTPEELAVRVRSLPDESIILYVWQQALSQQGKVLETTDISALVAREARAPTYSMSPVHIGRGSVGGYVCTIETIAAKLAQLTLRVVNGARPAEIAIEEAPEVPMFDWRQLQRWGIRESNLPPGSIVEDRELTMWQQYKWRILAAMGVFALQVALIAALLLERQRVRRSAAALLQTQQVLQESEERFAAWPTRLQS